MKIVEAPLGIFPSKDFTGKVNLSKILEGSQGHPLELYRVKFDASARTDWHAHQGSQMLYIESGECRLQKEGEPVQNVRAGNVVVIDAGEKHWHGASPKGEMVHIAIGLYELTDWFGAVSDAEFEAVG